MRALLGLLFLAQVAGAQGASVDGMVFDSLSNRPLSNAFISVIGSTRTATSDAAGRFHIDSLPSGELTFAFQHDVLDSIGIPAINKRVAVRGSVGNVVLSVPSFDTYWRAACGGAPPADSILVIGTVRDVAGKKRIAGATVEVSWLDLSVEAKKVSQHRRAGKVATDSSGAYALCGIPPNMAFELRASRESATSGTLQELPTTWRVQRRDLRIAPASVGAKGTIAGTITSQGVPFPNARVLTEGAAELRTGSDGRFVLRDIPAGTRQLEITAIGMSPVVLAVDVVEGDTVRVDRDLAKIVELPGVKVSAPTVRTRLIKEYEERRKLGSGYFVDSTKISKHPTLGSVLEEVPGAYIKMRGARLVQVTLRGCPANIILDGKQVDQAELNFLDSPDIAAMEVYPSGFSTPMEITARVRNAGTCGTLVVWTKQFIVP